MNCSVQGIVTITNHRLSTGGDNTLHRVPSARSHWLNIHGIFPTPYGFVISLFVVLFDEIFRVVSFPLLSLNTSIILIHTTLTHQPIKRNNLKTSTVPRAADPRCLCARHPPSQQQQQHKVLQPWHLVYSSAHVLSRRRHVSFFALALRRPASGLVFLSGRRSFLPFAFAFPVSFPFFPCSFLVATAAGCSVHSAGRCSSGPL